MAIGLLTLTFLLVGHWVADFVCQSHWMATNKSKNWSALTAHALVYATVMSFFMSFFFYVEVAFAAFFVITFITHFITDAITSRITANLWQKGDYHNFFVVVGLDQLIHYMTLIATMLYLSS